MKTSAILRIKREPNWVGDFRVDYDGKYIGLRGKDSNYRLFAYGVTDDSEPQYDEMVLGGAFAEGRNLSPFVEKETSEFIYINIGDERESVAWTKLVSDNEFGNVFDPDYF